MVSISYIYFVCIMLCIVVLYHISCKFLWNNSVYTDTILHYLAQAVESF